jgi:hypothetical protein
MLILHCDESDDGQTYALAGWLATPTGWGDFEPAWKAMLKTIAMPDGSECGAFHAAEIVGRDLIDDSKFKGWSFKDEVDAFSKAISVIEDRNATAILWPVGVAIWINQNRIRMNLLFADSRVRRILVGDASWNWNALVDGVYPNGQPILNPDNGFVALGQWSTKPANVVPYSNHLDHIHIEVVP